MAWSKESRHARGYGTAWDKLRKVVLERDHYLCQCDQCKGGELRLTPADQVNHKVPKAQAERMKWTEDQMNDPSNLEAVNADCHTRITRAQKGHRERQTVGVDGWPT